jgi:AcrR family transcriptional regulator
MQLEFQVKLSPGLYLRDPARSELGQKIIDSSIRLIYEIGYEQFTFKKVAGTIPTTEASVYRYFENKHKLLIYLIDLYWSFIEFQVIYSIQNLASPESKIKKIIDLLVWEDDSDPMFVGINQKALHFIAISEGSKTFLSKSVDQFNHELFFKPYKDLCVRIASVFNEYKPGYTYTHSLASSVAEVSHFQYYFMHHLPKLCDFSDRKDPRELKAFLNHLVFSCLNGVSSSSQ